MVIDTNMAAITTANNLNSATNMLNESLARLSSGSKIVNPSDDPANLAESISLESQVNETQAANGNVSNAISFSQTQDGYLQQVGSALDEMATLATEAQDVTKTTGEIQDYQAEYSTLGTFITDTMQRTFNGVSLFSGQSLEVTVGVNDDGTAQQFTMATIAFAAGAAVYDNAANATLVGATTAATVSAASAALVAVTNAINQLASDRGTVGANEEGLNFTSNELGVLQDNLTAANSTISDVDVATESTTYAKYQVLVQSSTAMLAQANQNPQSVLKLLS